VAVSDEMSWRRFYSGARDDLNAEDRFYHGTRADLKPGDLIQPGHPANFGKLDRVTVNVYFSATLVRGHLGSGASSRRRPRQNLHRGTDRAVYGRPQPDGQEISGKSDEILRVPSATAGPQ
jgi:hypothetical protein